MEWKKKRKEEESKELSVLIPQQCASAGLLCKDAKKLRDAPVMSPSQVAR
jgi:hypothetical protein